MLLSVSTDTDSLPEPNSADLENFQTTSKKSSIDSLEKSTSAIENGGETSPQSDDRFSLIGSYPPRERRKLKPDGEWSGGGSDSGSGDTPPPDEENISTSLLDMRRGSLRRLSSLSLRKAQRQCHLPDVESRPMSSLSNVEANEIMQPS